MINKKSLFGIFPLICLVFCVLFADVGSVHAEAEAPAETEANEALVPEKSFEAYIDYVNIDASIMSNTGAAAVRTELKGDGSYTVTLPASALSDPGKCNGAQRLRVIISGLSDAVADISQLKVTDVSVRCDEKLLKADDAALFCDMAENRADYAIELINEFGISGDEPAVNSIDIDFTKELSISFTITGISDGVAEQEQMKQDAIEDGSAFVNPEGEPADDTEDEDPAGDQTFDDASSDSSASKGNIGSFTMIEGKELTVTSSTNNGEAAVSDKTDNNLWKILLGAGIVLVLGVGIFFAVRKKA